MNTAHRLALPLFVAVSALSLSACKDSTDKPAEAASAAPEAKPGVTVTDARLVLPAVAGNPGAAYLTLDNQSKAIVAVAAVAVEGAGKTEFHTADMKLADHAEAEPGTKLSFTPGQLHVMVYDVDSKLTAGGETELTVVFSDGDKLSVPAKIQTAGDAAMGGGNKP